MFEQFGFAESEGTNRSAIVRDRADLIFPPRFCRRRREKTRAFMIQCALELLGGQNLQLVQYLGLTLLVFCDIRQPGTI